ncbi:MAG TPA: LacI family DNA-binding transcriptional regulator, partial [Actinospica sp.]|nr:LacI family DNA-binding transcriptional regulator [Actinospica sp.]
MRRPTLRDVAEGAGVHPATASRALNPATRHLVSRGTVERVDRIAASLGYRVNPVARSLKTARSGTVGLIVPDL